MKLFIETDFSRNQVNFYAKEEGSIADTFMSFSPLDGRVICTQVDHAESRDIRPLLILPINIASEFISQIAEYASGKGISTEKEDHLKGKLEATQQHLNSVQKNFDLLLAKVIKSK